MGRSARRVGRIVAIVLGAAAVLAVIRAVIFLVVVRKAQPSQPGSFYALPSPLPDKPPGTVIRAEPLVGLPSWARGWRVLYLSTSYTGKPTAVSGMVIVPAHASASPRPVVAFAHGTIGVASNCGLSVQGARYLGLFPGLEAVLAAGDVAVMTDYQGLGTPGPHPYLVGRSEGEDVLDAVRAAHNLKEAHAGTTFAVTGPSQGGHAALFAGQLAPTYAPDLKLVGIAASAPPTDLRELFRLKSEGTFGRVLAAYALDAWSQVYGHDLETVFTPAARPIVDRMVRLCLQNQTQMLAFLPLTTILKVGYLRSPPWQSEPWQTLLKQNTPGQARIPAPILISQGGADQLVLPAVTAAYVRRLCRMGEKVEYRVYPGVGHDAGAESAPDVVAWLANRFAGKPPPSTC
ncbi:MAG: alpha/beta fold hydrolase [Chloroflexi bacterium]|nr:alpha/beta fold hydrolase [Chloroflexota bacterium]